MDEDPRPRPVGSDVLLADHALPTASIRVMRITDRESMDQHVHTRSMQIYIALQGTAVITRDGVDDEIAPYETLSVWPQVLHSARPKGASCVVMNISVPPLAANDQHPVAADDERSDMRLPHAEGDIDD
jgi:mannose-6-phosphate isomerase-like protein (cupin superfamily)